MVSTPRNVATVLVPESPPPIVHAIGGSVGSALALLLLYPLERARIEMQSLAATSPPDEANPPHSSRSSLKSRGDHSASVRYQPNSRQENPAMRSPGDSEAGSSTDSFELVSHRNCGLPDKGAGNMPPTALLPTLEKQCDENRLTCKTSACICNASSTDPEVEISPSSRCQNKVSESSKVNEDNVLEGREMEGGRARMTKPGILSCLDRLYHRGELYRGVKPVVSTLAISNFVFFYALQVIKRFFLDAEFRRGQNQLNESAARSKLKSLVSSLLAGVINVLITNPLWVANLRIVQNGTPMTKAATRGGCIGKEPTLFAVMRHIARSEGASQLWSGIWASLVLVSNPAIQFFVYEQLKLYLVSRRSKGKRDLRKIELSSLSAAEAFVLGAFAKGIATVVTYPIQLAQVLLRLQNNRETPDVGGNAGNSNKVYSGTVDCIIQLSRSGGLKKLFSGMSAKLLQTVLTAAFTFLTYEQIVSVVQKTYLSMIHQP
mmetsp:Transcript_38693/g.116231  ORF Transcript_38693/g.116231 Transcript_38693/m.116231 type:complete len:490 (-) Transcript_38693:46-1515(-)